MTKVSVTSITTYLDCPRAYRSRYVDGSKKYQTYPLLLGKAVHDFIRSLHNPTKESRRYYYKSYSSAWGAWNADDGDKKGAWIRALEKNRHLIMQPLPKEIEGRYKSIGWTCINNYWKYAYDKPDPVFSEKALTSGIYPNIRLEGRLDQVRKLSVSSIVKLRPDLVVNGKLIEGYNPVVIVDFKTGFLNLDINDKPVYSDKNNPRFRAEGPGYLDEIRYQYWLHETYQPTAYTMLYERHFGKKPVGFLLWGVRENERYFTYRTEEQYLDLIEAARHVVEGVQAGTFPKIPAKFKCNNCLFFEPCRNGLDFLISKKNSFPEKLRTDVFGPVKEAEPKQISLGLRVQRKKKVLVPKSLPNEKSLEDRLVVISGDK